MRQTHLRSVSRMTHTKRSDGICTVCIRFLSHLCLFCAVCLRCCCSVTFAPVGLRIRTTTQPAAPSATIVSSHASACAPRLTRMQLQPLPLLLLPLLPRRRSHKLRALRPPPPPPRPARWCPSLHPPSPRRTIPRIPSRLTVLPWLEPHRPCCPLLLHWMPTKELVMLLRTTARSSTMSTPNLAAA